MGEQSAKSSGEETPARSTDLPEQLFVQFNREALKLLRVSVALALLTTTLFLTALVSPFWIMSTSTKGGAVRYGPFCFCREGDPVYECLPFQNDIRYLFPDMRNVPAEISASELLFSVQMIALLVGDGLLLWCVFKTPIPHWAKSALECTMSGFFYGLIATIVFVAYSETRDEKLKVCLGWSGYLTFSGLACQMLTAIFIYLTLRRQKRQIIESHNQSTLINEPPPRPKGNVPKELKPAAVQRTVSATPTESEDNRGPELMKILHMYRQLNSRSNKYPGFHYNPVHVDEDSVQYDTEAPILPYPNEARMSIEVNTFMSQLQIAAGKTEFCIVEPVEDVVNNKGTLNGVITEEASSEVNKEADTSKN